MRPSDSRARDPWHTRWPGRGTRPTRCARRPASARSAEGRALTGLWGIHTMTRRRQPSRPAICMVVATCPIGRRLAHQHSGVPLMLVSFELPRRAIGAALFAIAALPALTVAQSAADHVALGDRDHTAMNAPSALQHYQEAIKL